MKMSGLKRKKKRKNKKKMKIMKKNKMMMRMMIMMRNTQDKSKGNLEMINIYGEKWPIKND